MSKQIKSIDDKIKALSLGLKALKNANNHFVETKDLSYMLTIQSQLRGLVGMGGRSMHPLLINLSNELGIELEFYTVKGSDDENKTSSTVIGKTWSPVQIQGFSKCTIEDWLNAIQKQESDNKRCC